MSCLSCIIFFSRFFCRLCRLKCQQVLLSTNQILACLSLSFLICHVLSGVFVVAIFFLSPQLSGLFICQTKLLKWQWIPPHLSTDKTHKAYTAMSRLLLVVASVLLACGSWASALPFDGAVPWNLELEPLTSSSYFRMRRQAAFPESLTVRQWWRRGCVCVFMCVLVCVSWSIIVGCDVFTGTILWSGFEWCSLSVMLSCWHGWSVPRAFSPNQSSCCHWIHDWRLCLLNSRLAHPNPVSSSPYRITQNIRNNKKFPSFYRVVILFSLILSSEYHFELWDSRSRKKSTVQNILLIGIRCIFNTG